MNKNIALKNLIDLHEIFLKTKSEYWISSGTLLGFYRENDFIGHDKDTDVCVNINSLNLNLLKEIQKANFKVLVKHGRVNDGFELTLIRDGVRTDLFFFYKNKDRWYHSVYANHTSVDYLKYDYVFKPFNITTKKYLNHEFVVPENEEEVLIQQYGDNWKIPDKNWLYYKSPKNLVETGVRVLASDSEKDFKNIK